MATHYSTLSQKDFSNVNVVIAISCPQEREVMKNDLVTIGFKNILSTDNGKELKKFIAEGHADLLICDTALENGCVTELIYSMRLGVLGNGMFPVVVMIITEPTQSIVQKVINSGIDAILVRPFSQNNFYERVFKLSNKREHFVVTSDYIGPNRRQKHRRGTLEIPKITVPNPFRNKITGFYSQTEYDDFVQRTATVINEQRIKRQTFHIGYLIDKIQPGEGKHPPSKGLPPEWENLVFTVNDLSIRVKSSQFTHMNRMTLTLINFVNEMNAARTLKTHDFRLLTHLSNGISRSLTLN
ncbi:MAG: hypothetical protein JKX97_00010 [Candidatus Lindowbacteria bacterium]|nr:hypothetical protein [Candidatus Lindowbacteria bacterium]